MSGRRLPPSTIPPPIGPDGYPPEVWATLAHDRSTGPVVAVTATCLFLAVLVVALRVYTRRVLLNSFGLDDWFAVFSLVAVVITGTVIFVHTQYGLGTHIYDLSGPEDLVVFFKLLYATLIVYYTALCFIKLILCAQYYRLVGEVPKYRLFCRVIMGFTTAWCIVSIFLMVFQCMPIPAFWDKSILSQPGTSCHPEIYGPVAAIGNIVTDFILLLIPVPVIVHLNLQPGQKWLVFGIFSIGGFASIVSILRVALLPDIPDVTYTAAFTACWTMAETTAGLVCPCLMTLGPILKRVRPGLGFSNKSSDPARARTKSHTRHSSRMNPGGVAPRSRSSRLGHSAWIGGTSETELCRDADDDDNNSGGPPTTVGARSDAAGRPGADSADGGQAFELGPVSSRPRTGHRRDS